MVTVKNEDTKILSFHALALNSVNLSHFPFLIFIYPNSFLSRWRDS